MPLDLEERKRRIEQCAGGPARLRAAVAAVPEEALQWRPGQGEFSVHEVVCHCADAETNDAARIRYLAAEEKPVILGYDEEDWARRFDYHSHPLELALATVDAVRANTVPLLRRLPDQVWDKEGNHTQSGRHTGYDWLRIYSDHLEEHIAQIERVAAAWQRADEAER